MGGGEEAGEGTKTDKKKKKKKYLSAYLIQQLPTTRLLSWLAAPKNIWHIFEQFFSLMFLFCFCFCFFLCNVFVYLEGRSEKDKKKKMSR